MSGIRAISWYLPSGYVKIAIENGHRNSWFSHYIKMVIFHSYCMLVYRMVIDFDMKPVSIWHIFGLMEPA